MYLQFAKLEVGLDTKERLTTANKGRGQVHSDITSLDRLDDIILFAFVVQFEVLLVKGERCFGVVGEVEIEFLSHLTLHTHLYLLVKVKDVVVSRA